MQNQIQCMFVTYTGGHWSPPVYDLELLSRGILQWILGWGKISDKTQHALHSFMHTKRPPPSRRSTQNGRNKQTCNKNNIGLVKDMEETI